MLKINTNLERLGDFAEGIARFVVKSEEPVLDEELLKQTPSGRDAETSAFGCLKWPRTRIERREPGAGNLTYSAKDNLLDEINAEATAVFGRIYRKSIRISTL